MWYHKTSLEPLKFTMSLYAAAKSRECRAVTSSVWDSRVVSYGWPIWNVHHQYDNGDRNTGPRNVAATPKDKSVYNKNVVSNQ